MYHVFFVTSFRSLWVLFIVSLSCVQVVGPSAGPAEPECSREKCLHGENGSLRIFHLDGIKVCLDQDFLLKNVFGKKH